ncbi:hypothetical protein H4V97_002627 [Flavobacterium sp. CG_23.5]|nr:hypothetical protein [Flavobacterium sp. CG_23.5]
MDIRFQKYRVKIHKSYHTGRIFVIHSILVTAHNPRNRVGTQIFF